MDDTPDEVDLLVVGTGLIESVVAAAAARIGKTVLHIDTPSYYGADWASFSFEAFLKWTNQAAADATSETDQPGDESDQLTDRFEWGEKCETIPNIEEISYVPESSTPATDNAGDASEPISTNDEAKPEPAELQRPINEWTMERLRASSRKFNIDLCPRVIYSSGPMVDLLVASNICRYLEFKCVNKVCSLEPSPSSSTDHQQPPTQLIEVPCSRADIFNSKSISIVQKRTLMKFMSFCMELDKAGSDLQEFEGRTFIDLLKSKGVDGDVQSFLINSIAMCEPTVSATDALAALRRFTTSVGRFGNTPFLWTLYGSGELPQAFCRLCAVYGGTYCLSQPLSGIKLDQHGQLSHAIINTKTISCKQLVCGLANTPKALFRNRPYRTVSVSRAIFLVNKPLQSIAKNENETTVVRIPAHEALATNSTVTLIQVGQSSLVAPEGLYLMYCWCASNAETAKRDLLPLATKLFSVGDGHADQHQHDQRPRLLWSCYFNQRRIIDTTDTRIAGIRVANSPTDELDYGQAIAEAREIFHEIFGNDYEFLPRAPDAEDIVLETVDGGADQTEPIQSESESLP